MTRIPLHRLCATLWFALALPAQAVDVGPGSSVRFYQISYADTNPIVNTAVGWIAVDLNALRSSTGLASGYVNVATSRGWVVRNLPVMAESVYPYSRLNARLDLGNAAGVAVSQLTATVSYTASLQTTFNAVPAASFPVSGMTLSIGGAGVGAGGPTTPPNFTDILFSNPSANDAIIQYDHPNEEAARNQCAPMSIANSLQYLKNTQGLQLPHTHAPGVKGDNTMVGELDTAGDRPATSRTNGTGQWLIGIKLKYLAKFNLTGRIETQHWGVSGSDSGASNISATVNGVTATSSGRGSTINIDQVMQAMREGQNCEMVYSWGSGATAGAHAVDLMGAGKHNGAPWLLYASDVVQANAAVPDADRRGAGPAGVEFEYLGTPTGGVYTTPAGHRIDQVVCEKYVPPPAPLTVTGVTDTAGHGPFVDAPPTSITVTVNGTAMTVTGSGASWLPMTGTIAADGTFTLNSTATVAGFSGVTSTFVGRLQGGTYTGKMTIGAGGELPEGQPIAWDVRIVQQSEAASVAMRLNGFRHRLHGSAGELWRPSVSVKAGSQAGQNVDWWLVATTNGNFYSFDLASMSWRPGLAATHTGPIANMPYLALPYVNLPAGTYDFYFGFDTVADGNLNLNAAKYEVMRATVE